MNRLYRILKATVADKDEVVKFHVRQSIDSIDDFVRNYFLNSITEAGAVNSVFNLNLNLNL